MWKNWYGSGKPTLQARTAADDRIHREKSYQDDMAARLRQEELQRLSATMDREQHSQNMAERQFHFGRAQEQAPYEDELRSLGMEQARLEHKNIMEPPVDTMDQMYRSLPIMINEAKVMVKEAVDAKLVENNIRPEQAGDPEIMGPIRQEAEDEILSRVYDNVVRNAGITDPGQMKDLHDYIVMLYHGMDRYYEDVQGRQNPELIEMLKTFGGAQGSGS